MGIRLSANGTEGQSNWQYNGSGPIGQRDYPIPGYKWIFLPVPGEYVLNSSSLSEIRAIMDEFNNIWSPTQGDITSYANRAFNYKAYKFCILNDGDPLGPRFRYKNGVNSIQETTQCLSIYVKYDPLNTDWITNAYFEFSGMTDDFVESDFGSIPVFGAEADCDNYLNSDQPDPSGQDDPGSSSGQSQPITPSDTYSGIMGNVLSNLTVLAEIDSQNLGYIAAALNNQIDLGQDVQATIGKLMRAMVQSNIADGILSLKVFPIPSNGSLPYKSGTAETLFEPMGSYSVSGKVLDKTIEKYEIGRMFIEPIFNDYRDYMTEYSIYLPFSGIHKLDADIIVGSTIIIRVDIDFICGTLLYHIAVNDNQTQRDIYEFTGSCAVEIPITAKDYTAKYQAIVQGVFSGVGMMAGGMMAGPTGAGLAAAGAATSALHSIGNAATVKGEYIQSGKLVPNATALSVTSPYLIISSPQSKTPNISSTKGRPCHKVKNLSSCSGFSIISNIKLDNIPYATDEDRDALKSMLASGVYL